MTNDIDRLLVYAANQTQHHDGHANDETVDIAGYDLNILLATITDLAAAIQDLRGRVRVVAADPAPTDQDGRYHYICEAGHHIVSSHSNIGPCTARNENPDGPFGPPCGADIEWRKVPYEVAADPAPTRTVGQHLDAWDERQAVKLPTPDDDTTTGPAPTDPGEWSAEDRDRWLRWRAAHPQDDEDATDPARLWCGRCDRAITPDEIEEGNPTGSMPWWFHTCGDAVGLRGRRPDGTDFRSYVASLVAAGPAPTDPEDDDNVGRRMLAEQWRNRAADPAPTDTEWTMPFASDPAPTDDSPYGPPGDEMADGPFLRELHKRHDADPAPTDPSLCDDCNGDGGWWEGPQGGRTWVPCSNEGCPALDMPGPDTTEGGR